MPILFLLIFKEYYKYLFIKISKIKITIMKFIIINIFFFNINNQCKINY